MWLYDSNLGFQSQATLRPTSLSYQHKNYSASFYCGNLLSMAEQQLIDYIHTSQQSGISSDTTKQNLLSVGWSQDQVDEAYQVINIPKPPIPTPVIASKSSVSRKKYTSPYSWLLALVLVVSLLILAQNAVTDILDRFAPSADKYFSSQEYVDYQKAVADYEKTAPKASEYSDTHIYNQAYSEWYKQRYAKERSLYDQYQAQYKTRASSPSFRMIFNAILVLPFWIITFLFFISLKGEHKKYEALLGAYYITSGWLLIFLFFNVARYIWYSDTVMGVYVVLGMLVIILTGAIWGVQKYRHSLEN